MQINQKPILFSQQDIEDLAIDLKSLQGTIAQFFADRERGEVKLQTIQMILQLANYLIDFYDD